MRWDHTQGKSVCAPVTGRNLLKVVTLLTELFAIVYILALYKLQYCASLGSVRFVPPLLYLLN